MALNLQTIVQRFRPYHSVRKFGEFEKYASIIYREAAVLIPLVIREEGDLAMLLTKRSDKVTHHKGEVSFPGGSRDPGDSNPIDTAMRETFEEIGLPRSFVDVVAQLPPFLTRFNYLLHPVIALLKTEKNFLPVPNEEVDFCFTLPLERFLRREGLNVQRFRLPTSQKVTLYGFTDMVQVPTSVTDADADTDTVEKENEVYTYGLTAQLAITVASLFFHRMPEFECNEVESWVQDTPEEALKKKEQRLHDVLNMELKIKNSKSKL